MRGSDTQQSTLTTATLEEALALLRREERQQTWRTVGCIFCYLMALMLFFAGGLILLLDESGGLVCLLLALVTAVGAGIMTSRLSRSYRGVLNRLAELDDVRSVGPLLETW